LIASETNLGFAAGCNLGLRGLEADFYLLLNPDAECPPGSLAALVAQLAARPEAAVVAPALLDGDGRPTASCGDFPRLRHHLAAALGPAARWLPPGWRGGLGRAIAPATSTATSTATETPSCLAVDYVKGACFLMRRTAWLDVGPLDESFFLYFEETDWCLRARRRGWEVLLCPGVAVTHFEGQAAEQVSEFSLAQFQASYRRFVAKQRGKGWVPLLRTVQALEFAVKAAVRAALAGRSPRDRAVARRHWLRFRLQFASRPGGVAPPTVGSRRKPSA
jgi:hypothetical protein